MNATTATAPTPITSNIRHCAHCGLPYDWRRSTSSSLKMTYCGTLCEKGDLGFTIETLLEARRFAPEQVALRPAPQADSDELFMEWTDLIAA